MTSIRPLSSLESSIALRRTISDLNYEKNKASHEVATGFKLDVYADKSAASGRTNMFRAQIASVQAYMNSNRILEGKLDTMQTALTDIRQSAQGFLELSIGGNLSAANRGTLQDQAKAVMADVINRLNTTYSGEYLFSGLATNTAAYVMPDPVTTPAYNGDSTASSAKIDEVDTIWYGIPGDDIAFREILEVLDAFVNTNIGAMDDATFQAFTEASMAKLNSGIAGVTRHQAFLGNQQKSLDNKIIRQEGLFNLYNEQILNIEGVDMETAAMKLQLLTNQLEATYQVTAKLSRMSLLNYI